MLRFFVYILALAFSVGSAFSQQKVRLQGSVQNDQGAVLPYAVVSLDDTQYGAIADSNGHYSLVIPKGKHQVTASCLGYKTFPFDIVINGDTSIDIQLKSQSLFLQDVVIVPGEKDPAYAIIKAAIKRKKQNRRPFDQYLCEAYTKTSFGLPGNLTVDSLLVKIGDNFGGDELRDSDTMITDPVANAMLKSPLFYFSENISRILYKAPDRYKEEILHSRVSGNRGQFSFLGNLATRFDIYNNKEVYPDVAERGLISPISDNAFFFYRFKLLGTLEQDGKKVYKIEVTPRRLADPVYAGTIHISDSSYAVTELDLLATKTQNIDLLDSLHILQVFTLHQNAWVPLQSSIDQFINFNLLGLNIPIQGLSTSLTNRYQTDVELENKRFRGGLINIDDKAVNASSSVWDSLRPLPLNAIQEKDYTLKDEVDSLVKSPGYLDRQTQLTRKVNIGNLLTQGHTFRNYRKRRSLKILSPLLGFQYNPIEGFRFELGARQRWRNENGIRYDVTGKARYGTSNKQLSYLFQVDYRGKALRYEKARISAGNYPVQFSRFEQIREEINTLWSLIESTSYLRLYQKRFVELDYEREIFNGFRLGTHARYENRSSLSNTSSFSFERKSSRNFEENIVIPNHQALVTELRIWYQPGNRFLKAPGKKINLRPVWPRIELSLEHAIGDIAVGASDYTKVTAVLSDEMRLGIFGTTTWLVEAGRFLQADQVYFPDVFHQKGNLVWAGSSGYRGFFLLPYYARSTTADFVQLHTEHAFGGFLFNKIPGLRKLKLKEYIGIHGMWQGDQNPYMEMQLGIEYRVFKVIPLRLNVNVVLIRGGTDARRFGWQVVGPQLPQAE